MARAGMVGGTNLKSERNAIRGNVQMGGGKVTKYWQMKMWRLFFAVVLL
jgi:hypothetical protein